MIFKNEQYKYFIICREHYWIKTDVIRFLFIKLYCIKNL